METEGKICNDRPQLLAYAAGAVNEADAARVAQHLESCSRCRRVVEESEGLIRQYLALPTLARQHPTPEVLNRLAEEAGEGAELLPAQDHMARCGECQQIVAVLRKVQADLDSPSLGERLRGAARQLDERWTAWTRSLPSWVVGPLPAYVLVLLLLYPAYLGFMGLTGPAAGPTLSEAPVLLAPPIPIESEAERGPGENRLSLTPAAGRHVLTFFVPVAPERFRYRIELMDAEGVQLFEADDAHSFDGVGTFALIVPGGLLEAGEYVLRVEERSRDSGEVSQRYSFPFTVSPR